MGTPIVGARTSRLSVARAMTKTLTTWLPTYIVKEARRLAAEDPHPVEPQDLELLLRNTGDDGFPFRPRSINVATSFDDWHVTALPHVQILSPGYTVVEGDDRGLACSYEVQVACLVGADDHEDTLFIQACFEQAIADAVMQHQDLGGVAANVRLVGGGPAQFDDLTEERSRTFQGSLTVFEVLVQGVLDPYRGPAAPDPLPDDEYDVPPVWPQDPTVEEDGAITTLIPQDIRPA